ncbi:MAG TPA: TonB-dependent receptor plug domain-containing protein [Chryseosolibacter sp.]
MKLRAKRSYSPVAISKSFAGSVLFLFVFTFSLAQQGTRIPLKKVLAALEERYSITFTYADDNIASISLIPPSPDLHLEQALEYLRANTGLRFSQLNERFIAISVQEESQGNVCGTVISGDTGELMTGATVQLGDRFVITNDRGYFVLGSTSADSVLLITFIGYDPVAIRLRDLAGNPCATIRLQPQFTTLQPIFVSDFLTHGIDKRADGALQINTGTLGMLPGLTEPDVMQTIQTLPGIQSINETISDINVRGGTNDQNLILWDGIRIYHSGHFFGLISAFNPYLTHRVTLVKNGSSASLGQGVSSTIDIRTDDQLATKFSAAAGINMINGDVLAKIPLSKKMSVHVSARRSVADFMKTPAYKQYFIRAFGDSDVANSSGADSLLEKNEDFYFYDTSFKWLYDVSDRDKLRFSFLNVFNDIEYQEHALINNQRESRTSGLEQQNTGSGLSYSRLWNERVRTTAHVDLSLYDLSAVNYDIQNDQRLIQENKVLDTSSKIDGRIRIRDNIELLTGYEFSEVGVTNFDDINNPFFRRRIKKVLRSHAAFSEGDFSFGKTNMRAGVRANYYPRFSRLIVEPRFSLNQNFLGNFYFEALGEMKNQSSAQIIDLQSDFLGVEKRRWMLSNENDIPIIQSKQLSAGIYFRKNDFLVSVEGYYKNVEGITTSSQGFQNQFQFTRAKGSYLTKGLDFLVSEKVGPFTTWFSYSNADNTLRFPSLIPPRFPGNLDIRHRATLGCSFEKKNFQWSAGLNWHTGKPFTEPMIPNDVVNGQINYGPPNSSRLKDYLRIDVSAKYGFALGTGVRGEVGASAWNVPDRRNIIHQYYALNDGSTVRAVQDYALGFTSNVVFRIIF